MMRNVLAIITLLSVLLIAGHAIAGGASLIVGQPVAGVVIDYPGEAPRDLAGLIDIKKGDGYSPRKVSESIKLLFLKGIFDDITVEGKETDGGLLLVYHLVPKLRVTEIDIAGNDLLSKRRILSAISMQEDDFVEDPSINKANGDLSAFYMDEGFRHAEVSVTYARLDPLSAALHIDIKEGPPTVVKDVTLKGDLVFPEDALMKELDIKPGRVLRKEDLDKSAASLTGYYTGKDYVKAQVGAPVITYSDDTADVEFDIEPGPKLEVSFEGNDSISSKKLKGVLTFWDDRDLSEESISENLDKLSDYYKQDGYYFAALTSRSEETASPARVSVKFIVYEGPRVCLDKIEFKGNGNVGGDKLKGVMELKESSAFTCNTVTDGAVKGDLDRITTFYESNGYLKAEAKSEGIEFSKKGNKATLVMAIDEGPRTYVTSLEVEGVHGIPADQVRSAIKGKAGDVFSPQRLKEDQDGVLNLYSEKGYINATLDVEKKFTEDYKGVGLVYRIQEGAPVTVGKIILRGNEHAKDVVLTRELLVKTGDVYDYEKILRSQQRIFKLGFFSKVRVQPVEPEKVEKVKDLLVSVKEKEAGVVEFGGGYGDFDKYRGFAEISYRDLFGYGHRISLRGEVSTKQYKVLLGYKWPWFMGSDMDFRANLARLDAQKPSYTVNDLLASAGFDKSIGNWFNSSLYFQYEKIKLHTVSPSAVLAPEDKKKSNIASITPSVVFDFRDDPINPTKGSVHAIVLKWASTYLGSTVDFTKVTAQTSWYYPLYRSIIFGVSARGGYEGGFTGKLEVPISERFFLGGASNLRGFRFETVAPKGADGTPAGGDIMALFNTEVRFPLVYGFGLVTFLDAGNVWLYNKTVTAATVRQTGENGLRYGAGAGLRYDTPVGPLRLDYGVNLDPLPGEPHGVLHFTLGQAF